MQHWAATQGHTGLVKALLERSAAIETMDDGGWTPLLSAASAGRAEIVTDLLRAGADANFTAAESGTTPLIAAARCGRSSNRSRGAFSEFFSHEHSLRPGRAIVCFAWMFTRAPCVRGSASISRLSRTPVPSAWPPVRSKGHTLVVEALVASGAALHHADALSGATALHVAAGKGHTATVRRLCALGAAINRPDAAGDTALHRAAADGQLETASCLVELGASTDVVNREGKRCLDVASGDVRVQLRLMLAAK